MSPESMLALECEREGSEDRSGRMSSSLVAFASGTVLAVKSEREAGITEEVTLVRRGDSRSVLQWRRQRENPKVEREKCCNCSPLTLSSAPELVYCLFGIGMDILKDTLQGKASGMLVLRTQSTKCMPV